MSSNPTDDLAIDTLAVRAGIERSQFNEHSEALYLTSSFVFGSAAEAAARFSGEEEGNVYARFTNPTVTAMQQRLAALEGAEACVATSSGMAAILSTVMALLSAGDHIVASRGLFGARPSLHSQRGQRLTTIAGTVPELVDLPAGCPFAGRCAFTAQACHHTRPEATLVAQDADGDHLVRCLRPEAMQAASHTAQTPLKGRVPHLIAILDAQARKLSGPRRGVAAALRDALIACARRGVRVRLLLDAIGSGKCSRTFLAPLVEAGGEVASVHGVPHHRSLEDMLERDRPDGVILATPNALHLAHALQCIEAGLAVLLEKPITPTVAEAERLVAAVLAGEVGAVFHVYDKLNLYDYPRRYAVEHGKDLEGVWAASASGAYDLWVLGPNGFHRHFVGVATRDAASP